MQVKSWQECQKLCEAFEACKYWSWHKPENMYALSCALAKSYAHKGKDTVVSGPKVCPPRWLRYPMAISHGVRRPGHPHHWIWQTKLVPISQNLTIVIVTAEVSGDPPNTPAEKEIISLQKKAHHHVNVADVPLINKKDRRKNWKPTIRPPDQQTNIHQMCSEQWLCN